MNLDQSNAQSQGMPPIVEHLERSRFVFEKFDQLRTRTFERFRRSFHVEIARCDRIERLGQERRKVDMFRADDDPPASTSRLPERAGNVVGRSSHLNRQIHAQAK